MTVEMFLHEIPPLLIYIMVGLVIGVESLGVPLPGEIMLVTASLLSSRHELDISPLWIGISASTGAIIGDTIGYFIGRRVGKPLFTKLGRRFPKHFSPAHVAVRRTRLPALGCLRGLLRPVHRAAADLRRAAGRCAQDALLQVPGRQRQRRDRLGRRHHGGGVLPRRGRGDLAETLLLDRPGRGAGRRA